MIHLLDINVLIALSDPAHPHEAAALQFFQSNAVQQGWATCPIIENGFLRIFGSRKYPGGPGSPQAARFFLKALYNLPGHQFWADDVSIMNSAKLAELPSSEHLTNLYLLELAVKHGGRFVTFDTGMNPSLVVGGSQAYWLIQ
jgi:toxin-antitoxin system PIN domain toxin